MNKKLIKEFNNTELLYEICQEYGYEPKIIDSQVSCIIEGGKEDDEDNYTYNTIEDALIGWLDTLIESEINYIENNADITWEPEIEYIKELKTNLLFDKDSQALSKALTYGEIPSNLYKRLSVYIESQTSLVNRTIENLKQIDSNIVALNLHLPVEFILVDNKVEYIKIANKEFLNRLIFKLDTSEIDSLEQDIYDKKGLIEFMPLLPIDKIKRFELNIPIALTISPNKKLQIQTPIRYMDLF